MIKNVISKRRSLYVKKHRSYNLIHIIFSPIFRSFLWQLYDIVVDFDKIKFEIPKLTKKLYFQGGSYGSYMIHFTIVPMAAI